MMVRFHPGLLEYAQIRQQEERSGSTPGEEASAVADQSEEAGSTR